MRKFTGASVAGTLLLGAAGLVACSSGTPAATTTVTVTVSPTPAGAGASPPAGTTTGSGSATHTALGAAPAADTPTSPAPSPSATAFPGTCGSLLSLFEVQRTAGQSLDGKTAFVVGVAEKDIGRLSYLNCRYGLASASATPQVEIGVSLYDSATDAQARVTGTVQAYQAQAAIPTRVTVAGRHATILTGGQGQAFDVPSLVVAAGPRTVAVSVAIPGQSSAQRNRTLAALAALALRNTTPN